MPAPGTSHLTQRKISSIRHGVAQGNGDMTLVLIWGQLAQFETKAGSSGENNLMHLFLFPSLLCCTVIIL